MTVSARWRASAITLLDAAVILGAGAAIVVTFGGPTRVHLGAFRLSVRSAVRVDAIALALIALRLLAAGRAPLLPRLPRPGHTILEAERRRFAARARAGREVRLYAVAALAGSLVWIVPHLLHPRWVPDAGDPLFSAWRIARVAHQLVTDPRHLFDGNTFYPLPLSLTFSDSTLLEAIIGAPFILSGADPLIVANLLTILAIPACGLAFFYASWRLTDDPRAALVAALVGAWYPFHAEHYSHLELQWLMFVPLALVAGLRMLAAPDWRRGMLFGAALAAQWLASMYIGVMLFSFLVPFLLIVAIGWRVRASRALAAAAAASLVVLVPALLLLGIPYVKGLAIRGERGRAEVMAGSADPQDYGHAHWRLASYHWMSRANNRGERELMPGISSVALAAAGAVPPLGVSSIALLVSGAAAFDWSLGLKGLTYGALYDHSAAFRGMRVPARFSAIAGCALALLGAFGARRILRLGGTPRAQTITCALLAGLVLMDLRVAPDIGPRAVSIPSIYNRVTPNMVLAELPRDHVFEYMYFSTRHWAHLLGGYSGFMPETPGLNKALDGFPAAGSIAALKRLGATHLTYNCALEVRPEHCQRVLDALDDNPSLELLATQHWFTSEVRLYRIR
ncbi:MAG TPA: hypothetical protein VGL62_06255 [Vicinamibacterales bacterium]